MSLVYPSFGGLQTKCDWYNIRFILMNYDNKEICNKLVYLERA